MTPLLRRYQRVLEGYRSPVPAQRIGTSSLKKFARKSVLLARSYFGLRSEKTAMPLAIVSSRKNFRALGDVCSANE